MGETITENDFNEEKVKSFENKFGYVRNISQLLMAAILLAGLSGVLGYGLWTKKTKSIAPNIKLEYECILHARRETPFKILLNSYPTNSIIRVSVAADYFKEVNVRSILPQPLSMTVGTDSIIFKFAGVAQSSGFIAFNSYSVKSGKVQLKLAVNGNPITADQFIFP